MSDLRKFKYWGTAFYVGGIATLFHLFSLDAYIDPEEDRRVGLSPDPDTPYESVGRLVQRIGSSDSGVCTFFHQEHRGNEGFAVSAGHCAQSFLNEYADSLVVQFRCVADEGSNTALCQDEWRVTGLALPEGYEVSAYQGKGDDVVFLRYSVDNMDQFPTHVFPLVARDIDVSSPLRQVGYAYDRGGLLGDFDCHTHIFEGKFSRVEYKNFLSTNCQGVRASSGSPIWNIQGETIAVVTNVDVDRSIWGMFLGHFGAHPLRYSYAIPWNDDLDQKFKAFKDSTLQGKETEVSGVSVIRFPYDPRPVRYLIDEDKSPEPEEQHRPSVS